MQIYLQTNQKFDGWIAGEMEIDFPVEFLVFGTPVSLQAKRVPAREQWKDRVREAGRHVLPDGHFASEDRIAVTLYYLPAEKMAGDIDNIVKPILDALSGCIFVDDHQVERLVVQKFEPENAPDFSSMSPKLAEVLESPRPALYVKVSNDPFEDIR